MATAPNPALPDPARYFPLEKGRYEVSPGLRPLGTDWGNGPADGRVFQIDRLFPRYRANVLAARAECLEKYHGTADYSPEVASAVTGLLIARLVQENPNLFRSEAGRDGSALHCRLTGEVLHFDRLHNLSHTDRTPGIAPIGGGGPAGDAVTPPYTSALDALASQVPEDLAVTSTVPEGREWVSAVHVCGPSHWTPAAKLGQDFRAVHAPVPGMERINAAAPALVDAMVRRGPFVRFVWGISGDDRLNHHPNPPAGTARDAWHTPPFMPPLRAGQPPFYLRVERQVLWGMPDAGASLFAIRVSFWEAEEVRRDARKRELLKSSLLSMTPESRAYKGVGGCFDELISWLDHS